jgi:DNA-binding Xre family transcriptional regulator
VVKKITLNGKMENRMKAILAQRGMTPVDLAYAIDYHPSTVIRFCSTEQGGVNLVVIGKICEVLGIQPGDIFVYAPDQEPNSLDPEMGEFAVWLLAQAERGDHIGDLAQATLEQLEAGKPVPIYSNARKTWRRYLAGFGPRAVEAGQAAWKEWMQVSKGGSRFKAARQERISSLE